MVHLNYRRDTVELRRKRSTFYRQATSGATTTLATAQFIMLMEESAQFILEACLISGKKPFPEGAFEAHAAIGASFRILERVEKKKDLSCLREERIPLKTEEVTWKSTRDHCGYDSVI